MKSRYSFEDPGTDRQTELISECSYSQRPFKWYMTRLSKLKISWRRGKQYTSLVTLGGGGGIKKDGKENSGIKMLALQENVSFAKLTLKC